MTSFNSYDRNACNSGCHHSNYRKVPRDAIQVIPPTWEQFIEFLQDIDPVVAGYIDGAGSSFFSTFDNINNGIERTGQGLGSSGADRIAEIGLENRIAFNLLVNIVKKMVEFDLTSALNPFFQLITNVVSNFIQQIDPEQLAKMIEHGMGEIDPVLVKQAIVNKVIDGVTITPEEMQQFITHVETIGKYRGTVAKLVGQHQGKKYANIVAVSVAVSIAKQVAIAVSRDPAYKRFLRNINGTKGMKGGLAGALVFLLKNQGVLQKASKASQRLHASCPHLWSVLRNKYDGIDLLYFTIEKQVKPYIGLTVIAKSEPARFQAWMSDYQTIDELIFIR